MFSNIGGLEVLFVMMVALMVLGPSKLPEVTRQAGKFVAEIRRISSGFQKEFREAVQEPIIEAEARARGSIENAKTSVYEPFKAVNATVESAKKAAAPDSSNDADSDTGSDTGSDTDPTPDPVDD